MIINTLQKNSTAIVTTVMMVFSFAFACDMLCDLGVLDHAMMHHSGEHHHGMAGPETPHSEGHHHDEGHHHSEGHHVTGLSESDHHDEVPMEEDCCEEETEFFYAHLITQSVPSFEFSHAWAYLDLTFTDCYSFFELVPSGEPNPYILNSSLSPPVSGLYACILYQSFLC